MPIGNITTRAIMLAACASLTLSQAALAQSAQPNTWVSQQAEQAFATDQLVASPREGHWIAFQHGDRTLRGFVRYPDAPTAGPVPIVLVLHEVFGLTDSTRLTADRISAMGYITITPDMVSGLAPNGGGVSAFPDSRLTGNTVTGQSHENVMAQINAWADYGLRLPRADGRLAVVGLSWGGGAAFRYAVSPDHHRALRAVFAFYDVGPPVFNQGPNRANNPPIDITPMDVPVFGFYPTRDTRVMNSLPATREAMAAAGKPFFAVEYPEADHAYMRLGENPADTNPANRTAVDASLERLRSELARM